MLSELFRRIFFRYSKSNSPWSGRWSDKISFDVIVSEKAISFIFNSHYSVQLSVWVERVFKFEIFFHVANFVDRFMHAKQNLTFEKYSFKISVYLIDIIEGWSHYSESYSLKILISWGNTFLYTILMFQTTIYTYNPSLNISFAVPNRFSAA